MKQVSIRELQVNPSKCLEELPFEIVRYGKVVAVMIATAGDFSKHSEPKTVAAKSEPKQKREKKVESVPGLCKHNSYGYCMYGCFK